MIFYPITSSDSSSHTSSLQDCKENAFTDPPYSMHDITSSPLVRLRELEISGRGTLFPVSKHLLPKEGDSTTKKVMKVFFTPITALAMGFTTIVDHTLKYSKSNCIEKLGQDLELCNKVSESLLDVESPALQYFV